MTGKAIREALEPFAKVAEHDIGTDEADADFFRPMDRHNRASRLTVGDLRRARTAYDAIGSVVKARDEAVLQAIRSWGDGPCDDLEDLERRVLSCLSTHTAAGAGPVGVAVALAKALSDHVQVVSYRLEADNRYSISMADANRAIDVARHLQAALAIRPAEEPGEVEHLTRELRMIVSHATAGRTDGAGMSVNDVCVTITALRNELWKEARKKPEAALAEMREQRDTIEEAFADVCKELGCETDNEAALIAAHDLRERLEKLLAAVGKARTALAGFTSADDAAFAIDVVVGEVADWKRRAALTGDAQEASPMEKLGKFGWHPDPVIDFEVEIEKLESRFDCAMRGTSKPGERAETVQAVHDDIRRAMTFKAGGTVEGVVAKNRLRDLEAKAIAASAGDA